MPMGWTPPPYGISMCQGGCAETQHTYRRRHPVADVTIIGIDLAKQSFQLHGCGADGTMVFRRKLNRGKVLRFLALQPRCVVAMEACGSAHHWGREIGKLGHTVKLIPPVYVKPFVKRQKNDAADAEAICEAAARPNARDGASSSKPWACCFRASSGASGRRRQRAARGQVAEFGVVIGGRRYVAQFDAAKAPIRSCRTDRALGAVLLPVRRPRYTDCEAGAVNCRRRLVKTSDRAAVSIPGVGP